MMKIKKKSIVGAILVQSLLCGCIKEDLSKCGGVKVQFIYTQHNYNGDLIDSNVGDIKLYLFGDSDGVLQEVYDISQSEIKAGYKSLDIERGSYSFVAWGSSSENILEGDYSVGEAEDLSNSKFKAVEVGETKIDDLVLMLTDIEAVNSEDGVDNLFHAVKRGVDVQFGDDDDVVLDFVKNNNNLTVTLYDIPSYLTTTRSDSSALDIGLVAKNGRYLHDNSIDDSTSEIKYNSKVINNSNDTLVSNIRMLKIDMERHASDPIELQIKNSGSGENIIEPIDLLKSLKLVRDSLGVSRFKTQNDLDREDEYSIDISFVNGLDFRVVINGYEISTIYPNFEH